jgi:uncharacterized membrane protein YqgA involved in biofilm formation
MSLTQKSRFNFSQIFTNENSLYIVKRLLQGVLSLLLASICGYGELLVVLILVKVSSIIDQSLS